MAAKADAKTEVKADAKREDGLQWLSRGAAGTITGTGPLNNSDMLQFLTGLIDQNTLYAHNIESYNEFLFRGIEHILKDVFRLDKYYPSYEKESKTPGKVLRQTVLRIRFANVAVGSPRFAEINGSVLKPLFPNKAMLFGMSYNGPITASAKVVLEGHYSDGTIVEKKVEIPSFQITTFPIMVGSSKCNLAKVPSAESKRAISEDSDDVGGYFITGGQEYVIDGLENIRYNSPYFYRNVRPKEYVEARYISQEYDAYRNSAQLSIHYQHNGALLFKLNAVRLTEVYLPYYIIYRLWGVQDDKHIFQMIVGDLVAARQSAVLGKILEALVVARTMAVANKKLVSLKEEYDRDKIYDVLRQNMTDAKVIARSVQDNAERKANTDLIRIFDENIFPHIGKAQEHRFVKLRYLSIIIRRMFLVHQGIMPETDRDALTNKRIHGAGLSLAKSFKTMFNNEVIRPVEAGYKQLLTRYQFAEITDEQIRDTFSRRVESSIKFSSAIEGVIKGGNKPTMIGDRLTQNRLSSQALERKNLAFVISALRSVSTTKAAASVRQSGRAEKMRRVHPSFAGYFCPNQSADTDANKIGMKKGMAMTCGITTAGEVDLVITRLSDDLIPVDKVPVADDIKGGKVYVNGKWIGNVGVKGGPQSTLELVTKYRKIRRQRRNGIISPHTSICWDPITADAYFWLDAGRLIRPLVIVYNNLEEYDAAIMKWHSSGRKGTPEVKFNQGTRLTREIITALLQKKIRLQDLLDNGIIEYIAADEGEGVYLAPSMEDLLLAAHDVTKRYTHCDIEQAILGFAAATSPQSNCTQGVRITFETGHAKAACGWYSSCWFNRIDNHRFMQYQLEMPAVKTITQNFIRPSGYMIVLAYALANGNNQEDSLIVNKASADCLLLAGAYSKVLKHKLEPEETIELPDTRTTDGIKSLSSYSKLGSDGIVKVGSVVEKGDVLISIRVKLATPRSENITHTDNSVVYLDSEPAYVEMKAKDAGSENRFGLVKLRCHRKLTVGSKLSSRAGCKGITAEMMSDSNMMYTRSGLTPDIILNCHSIPTRMIIGQLIEGLLSKISARRGLIPDATSFRRIDMLAVQDLLTKYGMHPMGLEETYSGVTGEPVNHMIYFGLNYYQRTQLYIEEKQKKAGYSAVFNQITQQPMKTHGQNVRIGEMEIWNLLCMGVPMNIIEKLLEDSDGKNIYVCRRCGEYAVVNHEKEKYFCTKCRNNADIAKIPSCHASMTFRHELESSGFGLKLIPAPYTIEKYSPAK